MIIGIDYRAAINSVRGIGYYVKSLVAELALIDEINTYYLYVDSDVSISLPINFKVKPIYVKNLLLYEQYALPKQAHADQIQVLFYPSNSGPIKLHHRIRLVVTIHDLVFLQPKLLPPYFSYKKIKFYMAEKYRGLALKLGMSRIDEIITVSNFSAKEILTVFNRTSKVIYNHVYPASEAVDHLILNKLGIAAKTYYYTITGEAPHKNLALYLHLFKNPTKNPIVISGVFDAKLIRQHSSPHIIFTGYINNIEKATILKNAKCFLFLSLHEGFGLPLLEAMQYNLPIIASNRGAIPEVLGGGGELIDLVNVNNVVQALNKAPVILTEEIKAKQKAQLNKFSDRRKSALEHLAVFTKLEANETTLRYS